MDFKCLDCGYEWNHSDMVGSRKCPKCIGVNIERNPNAESVSANPLLSDVRALNTYLERINAHMWETFMVNDFMTKNQCIEIMKILNEWSEHF